FAIAEQVVRLVLEADAPAVRARHGARELNLLAPFLLHANVEVHLVRRGIPADVDVLVLDPIEKVELVETEQREVEIPLVVRISLVEDDFAPEHLVARVGVAVELDAANRVAPALDELESQIGDAGRGVVR